MRGSGTARDGKPVQIGLAANRTNKNGEGEGAKTTLIKPLFGAYVGSLPLPSLPPQPPHAFAGLDLRIFDGSEVLPLLASFAAAVVAAATATRGRLHPLRPRYSR